MRKFPFLLVVLFSLLVQNNATAQQQKKAPKIDVKLFFKDGNKSMFRISPDGQYYSYKSDYKGRSNIFVEKVGTTNAIRVTNDTVRSIESYFWKGNRIIYPQDLGGDENFQLFAVKPDGTGVKALTPFPGIRSDVIDDLKDVPGKEKELIVGINKRVKEHFDPYLVNIETGELTLLFDNKNNYDNWLIDNNGNIRMATQTDGVNNTYLYRNSINDTFHILLTTSFKEQFAPQSFDADNKNMYVISNIGRDKMALVEYDPVLNKEVKEIYANKEYDLDGIVYDRKNKKLISTSWAGEKNEQHFFDKQWGSIYAALQSKFPGLDIRVLAYTDKRTKGIVWTGSDHLVAKYYLFDFATKACTLVSNPYPWLKPEDMADMKPITYTTRDGLTVHGYLTIPKGAVAKNLPLVVNPHGGPWYRDGWGFNPEVQFLANRGYAVLQMNYRGSTGYGKKFWEASFKQWGKKMQDDITDGVLSLEKQGIVDSKRVAIYGGSYGGYATLAGITFTPDLYACAVDYVGVANLFTFFKTVPAYWKPFQDQMFEMVGNPSTDSVLLAEASPVLHADRIKTPLFIAQGANDPRVNKAESDQMVAALKKRGIEVEYMVKEDEGHGFHNQNNQFDFYGAMELFLEKYLKK